MRNKTVDNKARVWDEKNVLCYAVVASNSLRALIDSVSLTITVHMALIRPGFSDFDNYKRQHNYKTSVSLSFILHQQPI